MPQITHSVIDPVGGDAVGVTALEVTVKASRPITHVYRASDGAEIHSPERVAFTDTDGVYPSSWSIDLPANADLLPVGTHYLVTQYFAGDSRFTRPAPTAFVVPAGPGPYRLVDLLGNGPSTSGAIVVGFTPAGDWDPTVTYHLRQVVSYEGASWVARGTTTGVEPGTDAQVWQLVAASGTGDGVAITPDATTTIKGKSVLMGGTAANPTVPWSRVTGAPAVATQSDLSTHLTDLTPHPAYDDLPSLSLLFSNGLV